MEKLFTHECLWLNLEVLCACSWLGKMQVVHKILVEEVGKHPDIDALASAFVYLQVSACPSQTPCKSKLEHGGLLCLHSLLSD